MLLWNQPAVDISIAPRDSTGWQLAFTLINPQGPIPILAPIPLPSAAGHYTAALPLDSIGYWNINRICPAYKSMPPSPIIVKVHTAATAAGMRDYFRLTGSNKLAHSVSAYLSQTCCYSTLPYGVDVAAVVLQLRAGHHFLPAPEGTSRAGHVGGLPVHGQHRHLPTQRVAA